MSDCEFDGDVQPSGRSGRTSDVQPSSRSRLPSASLGSDSVTDGPTSKNDDQVMSEFVSEVGCEPSGKSSIPKLVEDSLVENGSEEPTLSLGAHDPETCSVNDCPRCIWIKHGPKLSLLHASSHPQLAGKNSNGLLSVEMLTLWMLDLVGVLDAVCARTLQRLIQSGSHKMGTIQSEANAGLRSTTTCKTEDSQGGGGFLSYWFQTYCSSYTCRVQETFCFWLERRAHTGGFLEVACGCNLHYVIQGHEIAWTPWCQWLQITFHCLQWNLVYGRGMEDISKVGIDEEQEHLCDG